MKSSRRKFIKRVLLGIFGAVILDAFWFEKYVIDWNYYDISKVDRDKIRIIQISDLHLDKLRSFHKSIAKKINQISPDLILITGDSIDKTEKLEVLDTFLQLISAQIRKVVITGNWEYWGNVDLKELRRVYAKHNCDFLINENKNYQFRNREITVIGIDDFIGGNADFHKSIQNIRPSDTTIVLSHCPEHRDDLIRQKGILDIDLILSGHTHGGQITFFGYPIFKPQGSGKYLKGWYKDGGPPMYISKGIGTSMLPIRFGARAEMVQMDI